MTSVFQCHSAPTKHNHIHLLPLTWPVFFNSCGNTCRRRRTCSSLSRRTSKWVSHPHWSWGHNPRNNTRWARYHRSPASGKPWNGVTSTGRSSPALANFSSSCWVGPKTKPWVHAAKKSLMSGQAVKPCQLIERITLPINACGSARNTLDHLKLHNLCFLFLLSTPL